MNRLYNIRLLDSVVAMTVVIFLLMIFFPVATTARSGGKSSLCLANLHILGHAWLAFAEDNDGKLVNAHVPRDAQYANLAYWKTTTSFGGPYKDNNWWVNPPHNAKGVYTGDPVPCTLADEDNGIRSGKLFPYVGSSTAYHCPSDLSYMKTIDRGGKRSYSITAVMHGEVPNSPDCADLLSEIRNPSVKMVFIEGTDSRGWTMGSWMMNAAGRSWIDPFVTNHAGRTALGFADGHGELHAWGNLDSWTGMPELPSAMDYMTSIYLPKK